MSIFKAYDIRGIYPDEVNKKVVNSIGKALVSFLKCKNVLVAQDVRKSSPQLTKALIKGITEQGGDVIDIGIASTDSFYYAVWKLKAEAGAMITASHNPKQYNGVKLVRKNSVPIGESSGMEEIEELVRKNDFKKIKKKGKITRKNVINDFVDFVFSFVDYKKIKPLKVVFNAYNGAGGLIAPKIFKKLPIKLIPMYFKANGDFPGEAPNPLLEENRKEIIEKVKKEKADIGIAVDGDCDRCFFIDNKGNFIEGDFILGLLTKQMLKKNPNSLVLYDVRCSWYVTDVIKKFGGKGEKHRVGHAFFKKSMNEKNAIFGGELSGHYYYKYKELATDNSWIPALQILELLSTENKSMFDLMKETRNYFTTGEINFKVDDKGRLLKKIEEKYKDGKIDYVDGVSIEFPDWKFNLRKSNTEPLVRLNLEGRSKKIMEKKKEEVIKFIKNFR